jgi:hypothetical protein
MPFGNDRASDVKSTPFPTISRFGLQCLSANHTDDNYVSDLMAQLSNAYRNYLTPDRRRKSSHTRQQYDVHFPARLRDVSKPFGNYRSHDYAQADSVHRKSLVSNAFRQSPHSRRRDSSAN